MATEDRVLKLGTRGSKLALIQANAARDALMAAHPGLAVEIVIISTTGDQVRDRALAAIGGKGLFTKEIVAALKEGRIDAAVHSMKDVPTFLDDGMVLAAFMEREDPRDALISARWKSLDDLPEGARIGTASVRRAAILKARRPDLETILFRGNVDTRLAKIKAGEADATLLAMAGLNRMGLAHEATEPLSPDLMLPAVAQGAVGLETRGDDTWTRGKLSAINHLPTELQVRAERALLAVLDGSCRTPISAYAEPIAGGSLRLRGLVAELDGSKVWQDEEIGPETDPETLGARLGARLREGIGEAFFEKLADEF